MRYDAYANCHAHCRNPVEVVAMYYALLNTVPSFWMLDRLRDSVEKGEIQEVVDSLWTMEDKIVIEVQD